MKELFKNYPHCENFSIHFTHTIENEAHDVEVMFDEGMDLLRDCADSKGIEFDGYFVGQMDDGKYKVCDFGDEFYEDKGRRNLFNFLSAKQDSKVFENLNYIWHICKQTDLTPEILDEEIQKLHDQGVYF
ncbi:MAG: hypothetical protein L6407_05255 [Candidatus Delongbacteria bacterium]|nr:hypothetical protein [Candidatus Delongbacteria bacterium]